MFSTYKFKKFSKEKKSKAQKSEGPDLGHHLFDLFDVFGLQRFRNFLPTLFVRNRSSPGFLGELHVLRRLQLTQESETELITVDSEILATVLIWPLVAVAKLKPGQKS